MTEGLPTATTTERDDVEAVAAQHREWIFLWDRDENDGDFDFDTRFADQYDFAGDDVILFDNADPERRVLRDAREFGRVFGPAFTALRRAEHVIEEQPEVIVSGGLAATRMVFLAWLTAADGVMTEVRAVNSQVRRRDARGRWLIVRDQTDAVVSGPRSRAS
ncbi:hypothetical protein ACFOVU_09265 [Nocardiopsis sediminis]|uniref:SnoaL-like domain-containing protein n=1 Tax=Nocardiopsis sediminis TaxID=1778267 RepID=A0ABV8FMK4_9ACTN